MFTLCCRICLDKKRPNQVVSLFDKYDDFIIRDALLDLFQIEILPTEILSTICTTCIGKVCTVRNIRQEFNQQNLKYHQILGTADKEPTSSQNDDQTSSNLPTVESTTEEREIAASEGTETSKQDEDKKPETAEANDGNIESLECVEERLDEMEDQVKHKTDCDWEDEPESPGKSPLQIQILETESDANEHIDEQVKYFEILNDDGDTEKYHIEKIETLDEVEACNEETSNVIEISSELVCRVCATVFASSDEYDLHSCTEPETVDDDKLPHNQSRRLCDKGDRPSKSVASKELPLKGVRKKIVCPCCAKEFETDRLLFEHGRRSHPEQFHSLNCNKCAEEFATKQALSLHKQKKHAQGRRLVCQYCGKNLLSWDALEGHENMHTQIQSFKCPICDKKFAQYTSMRRHLKIHSGVKQYECDFCKRVFRQRTVMLAHRRRHTGEKPYTCKVCEKCFRDHSTLAKHRRVHEKPKQGAE